MTQYAFFTCARTIAAVLLLLTAASPALAQARPASPINHIVLVIQENRSFDTLFSGFPGADSAVSGLTHDGRTMPLQTVKLEDGIDPEHTHAAFLTQFANGRMNGFDLIAMRDIAKDKPLDPSTYPLAVVDHTQSQVYWELAKQYTLADRLFQSQSSETFTSHLYLVAADADSFIDNPTGFPWGCDSPAGTRERRLRPDGTIDPGEFPCFKMRTMADVMDQRHVSWAYYSPAVTKHGEYIDSGAIFSTFDAVKNVRYGKDWANVLSPQTRIFDDIASGHLRQMSWVVPGSAESDHPGSRANRGPAWVGDIVNAIGSSKYWNDTAIVIIWDDWGGWYDHVAPPQLDYMSLGFRVPMIVVSPYAKRGYVSHTTYEFGSILKFVETTFGLPSLLKTDVRATSISDSFDFSSAVQPYIPVTTTSSAAEFKQIYEGLYKQK